MRMRKNKMRRGVTLTELLVVLAIIGLLSTIAIPVYVNKMEQAKWKTAAQECKEISEAEQACAIIHSYYFPIQLLDNIPNNTNNPAYADDLDNEDENSVYIIDAFQDANTQLNPPAGRPELGQKTLSNRSDYPRVAKMYDHWNGPFLNPSRVFVYPGQSSEQQFQNATQVARDFPLDPWGNPYRFYSPLGIIGTGAYAARTVDDYNSADFSNGRLTTDDDRFDRFAIVSYGPDGLPKESESDEDDIIYKFGHVVNESAYMAW